MSGASDVRTVAFHLPQFHPTPENDEWWGPGFTDWINVARATPRFRGHQQPHEPGELGYYDLRVPEVRAAQAELAAGHGIDAFCYYHYWFDGRQLLQRPVDEILRLGEPDFPFLLCWANEPWTRAWDGKTSSVLLPQTYSPDDDVAHLRWLAEVFADPRYLRIDGKPVFLVYRAFHLPDPVATTDRWRAEAARLGLGRALPVLAADRAAGAPPAGDARVRRRGAVRPVLRPPAATARSNASPRRPSGASA